MAREAETFMIEDANIIFKNFAGKEGQYNLAGDRNFAVIIPPEEIAHLQKSGWNVKFLEAREEGDAETAYITVAVNFKNFPPRVVLLTTRGTRTNLDADSVEVLDYANIQKVDLICRGYDWEVGPKSGTKAYLKSLFVTIEEDALEQKYAINE